MFLVTPWLVFWLESERFPWDTSCLCPSHTFMVYYYNLFSLVSSFWYFTEKTDYSGTILGSLFHETVKHKTFWCSITFIDIYVPGILCRFLVLNIEVEISDMNILNMSQLIAISCFPVLFVLLCLTLISGFQFLTVLYLKVSVYICYFTDQNFPRLDQSKMSSLAFILIYVNLYWCGQVMLGVTLL